MSNINIESQDWSDLIVHLTICFACNNVRQRADKKLNSQKTAQFWNVTQRVNIYIHLSPWGIKRAWKIVSPAQENMYRCREWQLCIVKEYSKDLFRWVLQFLRGENDYCMKPVWSNKMISLLIAGIESEIERLRIAELLRYILRFHFTFMAGAWGLKMCLPLLSIIQTKNTRADL